MKKRRSERKPTEVQPDTKRVTRNGARRRQDEEPAQSRIEPRLLLKESPLAMSCPEVRRNQDFQSREMDPSLEETLLAFLDTHGVRDVEDIEEDKLTFVDATYARSGVGAGASVPTPKMFQAIYRNIQEAQCLEVTIASFQLLKDLEKHHPRVAVAEELDKTSGQVTLRLDIDTRVWSPLEHTIDERGDPDNKLLESSAEEPIPLNLLMLVETIAAHLELEEESQHMKGVSVDSSTCPEGVHNVNVGGHHAFRCYDPIDAIYLCMKSLPLVVKRKLQAKAVQAVFAEILGQYLMLQHLVTLIQKDLYCRLQVSEANKDSRPAGRSYFCRLLCALSAESRGKFFSNLVWILSPNGEETADEMESDASLAPPTLKMDVEAGNKSGLLPSSSDFSHLAYRLLLMVLELDCVIRKWTPDNARSLWKDRFRYQSDVLNIFTHAGNLEAYLRALDSPWTKLRFIVDYFVSYAPSNLDLNGLKDSIDGETMEKLLAFFGEDKTKKFVHKYSKHILPLLLAHAFQAFISIHAEAADRDHENDRDFHRTKLMEVSQSLFHILSELREIERQSQMLPVAEHALEMAESILTSA